MEPLLSIIVPVYKTEAYLHSCIDSILAQTYSNLEIILIDDGSPDYCGTICDEYAKKDSRIRVIHKMNGGAAESRNMGIDIASGEYIVFVDSDDYLAPDLYETVMKKRPFEIAFFGVTYVDKKNNHFWTNPMSITKGVLSWTDDAEEIEKLFYSSLFGYACNKVYSKTIIDSIRFLKISNREDLLFNIAVTKNVENILMVDTNGYYYNQHDNSALKSLYSGPVPEISDVVKVMSDINSNIPKKNKKKITRALIKTYVSDFSCKYIFLNHSLVPKEKVLALKKIFKDETVKRSISFSFEDNLLFQLLTLCCVFKMPGLFYHIMKRRWK